MSYETNDKMVSHPDHYKSGKYEVIDIIDEFTKDLLGTEAVCTANAIKYILRWKKKNGIQDVKKAIWYLQHMVDKEEERLREEHAEFDEERLEKKLNRIRENSVYGIPKDEELLNEELKEEPTCSDCTFYEKGNCKFLNMHTMSDHDACSYLDPKTKEKEVDMDKIMNPPYDELYKMNNNQKETINNLLREKKEMQDSIDILTDDKKSLQDLIRQLRKEDNNTGFVNGLKEANKQLAEDFNNEVDMNNVMNRPTNEEVHSCDDCVNKANEPWDDPCQSCDLHQNPPSKWESKNATVTDKQVVYATKVISKYCNSIKGCNDCPFFSPHSVDSVGGITCKLRLNSPNSWDIEEKK